MTARPARSPGRAGASALRPRRGPGADESRNDPPHEFVLVQPGEAARDEAAQRRLWEISERLTGVTWPV